MNNTANVHLQKDLGRRTHSPSHQAHPHFFGTHASLDSESWIQTMFVALPKFAMYAVPTRAWHRGFLANGGGLFKF